MLLFIVGVVAANKNPVLPKVSMLYGQTLIQLGMLSNSSRHIKFLSRFSTGNNEKNVNTNAIRRGVYTLTQKNTPHSKQQLQQ
jgi:hypothetical protein